MLDGLADAPVQRFMCPDTLGVLDPYATERFLPRHGDALSAAAGSTSTPITITTWPWPIPPPLCRAGFHGVHVTVNGLGERAGNAPLSSTVAVLHDRLGCLRRASTRRRSTASAARSRPTRASAFPANRPIVGESVFTQCAGIHADGDNKNNLYFNELLPERFGRVREYALGKTSGKANILKNLEALGIDLDEAAMRKVTERVVELSDKKELVTAEDLPYIIADVLRYDLVGQLRCGYSITACRWRRGCDPCRYAQDRDQRLRIRADLGRRRPVRRLHAGAAGRSTSDQLGREFPMLRNYTVSIPPGGRTDAFVQTIITWETGGKRVQDPRAGCRPDRSRHQGDDQNAEHNRTNITTTMDVNIALLAGDGIGPEIIAEATKVLDRVAAKFGHQIRLPRGVSGRLRPSTPRATPIPTRRTPSARLPTPYCSVPSATPSTTTTPRPRCVPSRGCCACASRWGCSPTCAPSHCSTRWPSRSPLQAEVVRGTDFICVRELTGGIYFGRPQGRDEAGTDAPSTPAPTRVAEIERVLHVGVPAGRFAPPATPDGRGQGQRARNLASVA